MFKLLRNWLPDEPCARRAVCVAIGGITLALTGLIIVIWLTRHWPQAAEVLASKGKSPRIEITSLGLVWKAFVLDAALLSGLLITARWWARPILFAEKTEPDRSATSPFPFWQRLALLLVLGSALWLRAPRMSLSLYNDEAHNYARLWSGSWEHKSDQPKWRQARWGETLFLNNAGNNSQPYSLAARASLEAAYALGIGVRGEVIEWAVRLPALIAGLLTLWLAGALARRHFGFPGQIAVMLALSLHGWHQRYSTEARGYSFMLLGIVIMLFCLDLALTQPRWRHWLGFAAGLFLCAVSFLGSIYFLISLFSAVLLHQAWRWRQTRELTFLLRPLVAGLLAIIAALPLLLPMLPQLMKVLETHHSIQGVMGTRWWRDVAGYLIAGTRWVDADPENPFNPALSRWITQPFWLLCLALWLAIFATGLRALWRRGGLLRLQTIATPIALLLAWGLMTRQGNFLNHWYLLYALPWLALTLGAGTVTWIQHQRLGSLAMVLLAGLVPLQVALVHREHPKQDERAPVLEALGAAFPHPGKSSPRPLLGAFWCNSNLYHPEVLPLRNAAALESLMERSRRENRPLFVCHSHRPLALQHSADLMSLLEDATRFEKVRTFPGLEESQNTLHLFRLHP